MSFIRGLGVMALAASLLLTATVTVQADPSLYSRLGEGPGIGYLVDTLLFKVSEDGRINKRFKNANIPRLKKLIVQEIEAATGGPQRYRGKSMSATHKGMGITKAEFSAFVQDFTWSMKKIDIGPNEQKQMLAKIAPMESQVVETPAPVVAKPVAKGAAKPGAKAAAKPGAKAPAKPKTTN